MIQDFRPKYFVIFTVLFKCLISFYEHLGDRAKSFVIGLTDVSPAVEAPRLWDYDVCGQWPGEVATGATVHLRCEPTGANVYVLDYYVVSGTRDVSGQVLAVHQYCQYEVCLWVCLGVTVRQKCVYGCAWV